MNKKMEIKQVKVYQSVKFEGTEQNYFIASKYKGLARLPTVEIEELENGQVIVKSEKDFIKVGHANVSFIQYALEPKEEKKSK